MDDDLKKLMLHSVSKFNLGDKVERPMTPSEEKALLAQFSETDFPDEFNLAIIKNKAEHGKLFSRNALEKFFHTVRLYIGGRILGDYNKTNKSPEVVVVYVRIERITKKEYEERLGL